MNRGNVTRTGEENHAMTQLWRASGQLVVELQPVGPWHQDIADDGIWCIRADDHIERL